MDINGYIWLMKRKKREAVDAVPMIGVCYFRIGVRPFQPFYFYRTSPLPIIYSLYCN